MMKIGRGADNDNSDSFEDDDEKLKSLDLGSSCNAG